MPVFFLNRVGGLRPTTLLKKRLWHRCFPVSFPKFSRTPFFIEQPRWLLLYLEISQNSQESTCAKVSFLIKLQASGLQRYWKRDFYKGIFLWILRNLQKHLPYRISPDDCFCVFVKYICWVISVMLHQLFFFFCTTPIFFHDKPILKTQTILRRWVFLVAILLDYKNFVAFVT